MLEIEGAVRTIIEQSMIMVTFMKYEAEIPEGLEAEIFIRKLVND